MVCLLGRLQVIILCISTASKHRRKGGNEPLPTEAITVVAVNYLATVDG